MTAEERAALTACVEALRATRDDLRETFSHRVNHDHYRQAVLDQTIIVLDRADAALAQAEAALAGAARDNRDDLLEMAWGIIANVSGGDWAAQNDTWRGAAERWRDGYHRTPFPRRPAADASDATVAVWTPCDDCKAERDRLAAENERLRAVCDNLSRLASEHGNDLLRTEYERDAAIRERDEARRELRDNTAGIVVTAAREMERRWAADVVRDAASRCHDIGVCRGGLLAVADRIERGPAQPGDGAKP